MQDLSGSNRLPQTVAMFWQSAEMQGAEARQGLTLEPGRETWNAPMCCVMPPASPAATDVLRRASSRDVWQPQAPSSAWSQATFNLHGAWQTAPALQADKYIAARSTAL